MIPMSVLEQPLFPEQHRAEPGQLEVLNCGMGDLKISFNSKDPEDVERARKMVTRLLEQGCFIIVTDKNGRERRVQKFDAKRNEYIVKELPDAPAEPTGEVQEEDTGKKKTKRGQSDKETKASKKSKDKSERIPAKDVKATAVAPRSGG